MPDAAESIDPTIRVVSDDLMSELESLQALEDLKRVTPVDDPGFPQLARDVEAAARSVLAHAAQQTLVAEEAHEAAVEAGTTTTIEDLPDDLTPAEILARWREVDRERSGLERGSPRWVELGVQSTALRRAYQRQYERDR